MAKATVNQFYSGEVANDLLSGGPADTWEFHRKQIKGYKLWEELDADGSRTITREEWNRKFHTLAGFSLRYGHGTGNVITRRDWASKGGDGATFDAISDGRHEGITKEDWKKAFGMLDKDNNGTIDLNEWETLALSTKRGWKNVQQPQKAAVSKSLQQAGLPRGDMTFSLRPQEEQTAIKQGRDAAAAKYLQQEKLDKNAEDEKKREKFQHMQAAKNQAQQRGLRVRRSLGEAGMKLVPGDQLDATGHISASPRGGQGSEEKWARKTLFGHLDMDGNGNIGSQEWMTAFNRIAGDKGVISRKRWASLGGENALFDTMAGSHQKPQLTKQDWRYCFERLDRDSDGVVSLEEWLLAASLKKDRPEPQPDYEMEPPADGPEFARLGHWLGGQLFEDIDVNKDGTVSLKEWLGFFDKRASYTKGIITRQDWLDWGGDRRVYDKVLEGTALSEINRVAWRRAFIRLDQDKSGTITSEEWPQPKTSDQGKRRASTGSIRRPGAPPRIEQDQCNPLEQLAQAHAYLEEQEAELRRMSEAELAQNSMVEQLEAQHHAAESERELLRQQFAKVEVEVVGALRRVNEGKRVERWLESQLEEARFRPAEPQSFGSFVSNSEAEPAGLGGLRRQLSNASPQRMASEARAAVDVAKRGHTMGPGSSLGSAGSRQSAQRNQSNLDYSDQDWDGCF